MGKKKAAKKAEEEEEDEDKKEAVKNKRSAAAVKKPAAGLKKSPASTEVGDNADAMLHATDTCLEHPQRAIKKSEQGFDGIL